MIRGRTRAALLCGVLALLATACGGDDSGDDDADATTVAPATTAAPADSSTTTAGDAGSTAPAETTSAPAGDDLAALVASYEERPMTIAVTEPIGKPVPSGKRIATFVCPLPACQELAGMAKTAAEALSWDLVEIPIGFAPEEVKTAWEQALREEPDGILTLSSNRAFFEPELAKAEEQGIPVLSMLVDTEPSGGVTAVLYGPDFMQKIGKEMADWVTVDSGGQANTVMIFSPQIGILTQQSEAFRAEYEAECADCELSSLEVPATSVGNDLTTRIVGHLRANPDIDYAWVGYGDMLRGLPAAMKAAGIEDVKVFSNGGSLAPDSAEYLRSGDTVQMFYAYAGTECEWRAMDWFARYFAGVPTTPNEDAEESPWIVTPESAPEGGTPYLVEDYAAQYKALWGVG
jgi:ribose transport system substrate-binding protein